MTDPAVHDADPGVHDGPIWLFTMGRFPHLDMQPLPDVVLPERGRLERPRFARDIKELLAAPLEDTDAPH